MFKKLFRKNELPVTTYNADGIGTFTWNGEDEYWEGTYNGVKVSISYDGYSKPTPKLVGELRSTLLDNEFPSNLMNRVFQKAASEHLDIPELKPKDIIFQKPGFVLIQFFSPEDHEPFWFAEIHSKKVYIGCDT